MRTEERVTFKEVVDLYERAGFIYPGKKCFLLPCWEEITDTWNKLLATTNGLFKLNRKTRDGSLSSSISIARYTDRTWLIQHAVGVHDPGGVLGNLLDVCEWAVENPDCRYVRFLYRPTNRWPSLVFGQLTPKLQEGSYETHVYDYHTCVMKDDSRSEIPAGVEVSYLEPCDYECFERELRGHRSDLYVDAHGLAADQMDLRAAGKKYAGAGLIRQRKILVARREGNMVGFSVVDESSLGINLSFLLNSFMVTIFENDDDAAHGLVVASIDHYRRLGRRFAVALCEGDSTAPFTTAGMETKKQYAEMLARVEGNFSGAVAHFKEFYNGIGAR